jgi:DNA processing protein
MDNSDKNLIMLNVIFGPNNNFFQKIEEYFEMKDFSNFDNLVDKMIELKMIDLKKYNEIIKFIREDRIQFYINYLNREKIKICTKYSEDYPQKLSNIENKPFLLYFKGNMDVKELNRKGIAVVGSRKSTSYGKWVSEKLVSQLSRKGINIISGMAQGVDTIAHEVSLKMNNPTVAVLGSGVDVAYPTKNKILYDKISEMGLIISEFPPGTSPMPYNFPLRNRIISGLSDGVLVIEAGEKSGSLITATHAVEQGREVFAVPGNIDSIFSKGTNKLIREGAKITTCADDIIEEFSVYKDEAESLDHDLNEIQIKIINLLETGEKTILELKDCINYELSDIYSNLTILEILEIIKQEKGKKYRLNSLDKFQ